MNTTDLITTHGPSTDDFISRVQAREAAEFEADGCGGDQ